MNLSEYTVYCITTASTICTINTQHIQLFSARDYLQTDTADRHNSKNTLAWVKKILTQVYEHIKEHVISPTSLQHNTSYTMFDWTFLEVFLNALFTFEQFITQTTGKNVCILNVLDDAVSIHMLYRNALDIHCKHTASQLHVAERVLWGLVCCRISSDKCHTWTKYLHCVTSADVSLVHNAV